MSFSVSDEFAAFVGCAALTLLPYSHPFTESPAVHCTVCRSLSFTVFSAVYAVFCRSMFICRSLYSLPFTVLSDVHCILSRSLYSLLFIASSAVHCIFAVHSIVRVRCTLYRSEHSLSFISLLLFTVFCRSLLSLPFIGSTFHCIPAVHNAFCCSLH